jgi:hypothetical protein
MCRLEFTQSPLCSRRERRLQLDAEGGWYEEGRDRVPCWTRHRSSCLRLRRLMNRCILSFKHGSNCHEHKIIRYRATEVFGYVSDEVGPLTLLRYRIGAIGPINYCYPVPYSKNRWELGNACNRVSR